MTPHQDKQGKTMSADDLSGDTLRGAATRNVRKESLFQKLPEQYYQYALEWCSYPHWTIEETANLITGCVPHRPMFLKGEHHASLDQEVLDNENLVRAALNTDIQVVKSRKYFGKTYVLSQHVFHWAEQKNIFLPADLLKADQVIRHRYDGDQYTTPCLEAVKWVVENFWEHANLREPPTAGAIIHALLQKFPGLSGEECDLVERVTRHPLTRPD